MPDHGTYRNLDPELKRERNRRWRNGQRKKRRAIVVTLKEETPCADCGQRYPYYVMDFDHVRGTKVTNIAPMVTNPETWSMGQLIAEIAKCEIVCANCHRERTHSRREEEEI